MSYKINPNCRGSFSQLDKDKKGTIHPINDDKKCFKNAATIALNHEEIGKNSQRI